MERVFNVVDDPSNQNPLDPMKNEQFVAQLAQFSRLEGITNMSTSLSDVADVIIRSHHDGRKSGWEIRVRTNGSDHHRRSIRFGHRVQSSLRADQVEVGIYDPVSGALMRSMVVGPQSFGTLNMA